MRVIPDNQYPEALGEARNWFSLEEIELFASTSTSSRGSQTGASLMIYKQTSVFHVVSRACVICVRVELRMVTIASFSWTLGML